MHLIDYFLDERKIGQQIKEEDDHQNKILLLNKLSKTKFTIILCLIFGIIIFFTFLAISISFYPHVPKEILTALIVSLYFLTLPFLYKFNHNDVLLRFLAIGGAFVAVCFRSLTTHGISSAPFYWLTLIPLCSALIFEKKMIYWSLGASILISFIIFNGERWGLFLGPAFPPIANYSAFIGLLFASSFTAISFDRKSTKLQNQLIEIETKFQDTQKLASLGNMAAGVAHEINNPLMIIAGNLQQLERSIANLDLDQENYFKISNHISKTSNNISRINKIIQSLLSYSHMQPKDSFKAFSLKSFITDLQAIVKNRDQIHNIDLNYDAKTLDHIIFHGDQALLTQVFMSILLNAWQATKEREDFKITIHCKRKEDFVEFHIIDQGKITDSNIINNMFHPFFTTKPIGQGTGLGLSQSKGIIESHQGELYYDKSYPTSCFVLKLPYTS